jgi:hypothetical protein
MAKKAEVTQKADVVPAIPCAHEECQDYAVVKLKTKTGWARLCMRHYDAHHAAIGAQAFRDHGLEPRFEETRTAHRARVFAYWRELSRRASINRRMFEDEAA